MIAIDASGMPVMPTTVPPVAACHCDSARLEKRGPLTTTRVPPSTTGSPARSAVWRTADRPRGQ